MADGLEELWAVVHPNAPKRKRRSKWRDLEASVLRECIEWLRAHPEVLYVERRNTGAMALEGGGFIRFGSPGAADLWCIIGKLLASPCLHLFVGTCNTHVEIECKRRDGKGRLSASQKAFKAQCAERGTPYLVVTSAQDLEKKLQESGLIP